MGELNRVISHVRRILGKHATLNSKIYTVKIGCFKLLFHHDPVMFTSYAGQVCDSSKPLKLDNFKV